MQTPSSELLLTTTFLCPRGENSNTNPLVRVEGLSAHFRERNEQEEEEEAGSLSASAGQNHQKCR